MPERKNGPFFIVRFPNHVHKNGQLYNGYSIRLHDVDSEECVSGPEDKYQAWCIGGSRVLVRVPAESAAEKAAKVGTKEVGYHLRKPRIYEAYNVARNEMLDDRDRHSKYYLLDFPDVSSEGEKLHLDNSILSPDAHNGEIEIEFIPLEYSSAVGKKKFENGRTNLIWDICIAEPKPRYTEEAPKKENRLAKKLEKHYGGSSMSTTP